jgi:hypothetical protein
MQFASCPYAGGAVDSDDVNSDDNLRTVNIATDSQGKEKR